MLIERYHWSLAEAAQIDEADPDFMTEFMAMLGAIADTNTQKSNRQDFQDFKARHRQKIAQLQGKR